MEPSGSERVLQTSEIDAFARTTVGSHPMRPDSRGPTPMSFAVVSSLYTHTRSTALEESIVTATYTFDVFTDLDGYGSHSGDWGGYWGKQGPELLDHRLALYDAEQRMVFGANTYRMFARMLASSTEESEVRDPWVTRMRSMPATVVSTTLEGPLDWPDATVVSGDAVDVVVAVDQNPFLSVDGVLETRDGLFHAEHQVRFVKLIVSGSEKGARGRRVGVSAIDEQCSQDW